MPAKGWAEIIRKVYEIDPLLFPSCIGRMSVVSFIEEPKTIDSILFHLEMRFEGERPFPPRVVQRHLLMAADEAADNTALKHAAEPE